MGMFDSLYDSQDNEWQTKAFDLNLDVYRIGDTLPAPRRTPEPHPPTYQVWVFGGPRDVEAVDAYATVRSGKLATLPDERDEQLPLIDYHGGWLAAPKED